VKPFRFNLEKVLKVRQRETLKAKQALAAAQLASGQAWVALEKARAERVAFEAEWEERRKQRMPAREWMEASQRHEALMKAEKAAAEALHQALAVVAQRRAELEEAERREKALDRLREQQYEAHAYEMRQLEQAEMDEIAQAMRRTQGGIN
jgi:flagellar FliJ protein